MTTQQDAQLGFKVEGTPGTPETVDTFTEFIEEDLAWMPEFVDGAGLRVGGVAKRADRHAIGKESVGGSFTTELYSKGHGKLFKAALGIGASNNISGASYQQLFTPVASDFLDSYTIQLGIPPLGGGTTLPHTFNGMVCSGFEFSQSNGSLPTIKWNWEGFGYDTSTSLETASYPASTTIFSYPHASVTIGGSLVVPSTTALSSGGTATSNVKEFNLTYDNGLDTNRWSFGSAGKPTRRGAVGLRSATGNLVAEFDSATLRDLYRNQTSTGLTYKLQTGTAISGSNYPTIEFTIPAVKFLGELPKTNGGDVVTLSMDFEMFDGGVAASPFYVAIVTAETAI